MAQKVTQHEIYTMLKIFFVFLFVCVLFVCVCVHAHVNTGEEGPENVRRFPGAGVTGTKKLLNIRSPVRAVFALTH